ncbi:hypothetical protein TSAR_014629 [Trichomalopsis sarcophagae]|uniref:Uncharacterized protein n=1 Tax=Trichomalopsis sarcophagae TaxID=543379 RepID=A0A232EEY9_9HYME|nr:hypothetical protein TSAR_014629 [Trichomalopsis sarcophagae]
MNRQLQSTMRRSVQGQVSNEEELHELSRIEKNSTKRGREAEDLHIVEDIAEDEDFTDEDFIPEQKAKSLSPSPSKPADGLPEDLIKSNKNNSIASSTHGELTEVPSWKNLSTIEQEDSEKDSEAETFVHQNLPEKVIEVNERLEQADNMDSQKPVDDSALRKYAG